MSREVRVTFHAQAADLAGTKTSGVDVPHGATCADVKLAIAARHPALGELVESSVLATEREYLSDAASIEEVAELHLIPPVSGG